jgi:hypothetical protein
MNLNEKQREAVEEVRVPVSIIAGPGTGKTKTLTEKIKYLVEKGFPPEKILALTFTKKAAKEIRDRLGNLGKKVYVSTFHAEGFAVQGELMGTIADEVLNNNKIKKLYGAIIDPRLVEHPTLEFIQFKTTFNSRYFRNVLVRSVKIILTKDELNLYELVTNPNIVELNIVKPRGSYAEESARRWIYIQSDDPSANDLIKNNCTIETFNSEISWKRENYTLRICLGSTFTTILNKNKGQTRFKKVKMAN